MDAIYNSIDSLLIEQNKNGMLPYLGWDYQARQHSYISFTYHLHNLISLAHYIRFSGNDAYLTATWPRWVAAMNWSLASIDSSGLMNVTSNRDWLRSGMGGHVSHTLRSRIELTVVEYRSQFNSLLYAEPRYTIRNRAQ